MANIPNARMHPYVLMLARRFSELPLDRYTARLVKALRNPDRAARFALSIPILLFFDAWSWTRDSLSLLRGNHRRVLASLPGDTSTKPDLSRAAIVAWLPDRDALFSLTNLLTALRTSKFSIVLVANRAPEQEALRQLRGLYDQFLLRTGEGRDFGAFKCGFEWLQASSDYSALDVLLFANDSLYYSATGIARDVKDMLDAEEDWACLFESLPPAYHAQSFFQVFRRPVLSSEAFSRFWNEYVPRSTRRHAIKKGELGLSRALLTAGFHPFAVYSSSRIGYEVAEALAERWNDAELHEVLNLTALDLFPQSDGVLPDGEPSRVRGASLVSRRIEVSNPTHVAGLLCNWLFESPLKRDLNYRGTHTIKDIVRFARGFERSELDLMERDLRHRVAKPMSAIDRILWRYGRK